MNIWQRKEDSGGLDFQILADGAATWAAELLHADFDQGRAPWHFDELVRPGINVGAIGIVA